MEISANYDPMIAKVIAHGANRDEARARLVAALRETVVMGVETNQAFLIDLLEDDLYIGGKTYTHSVEPWTEAWTAGELTNEFLFAAAAVPAGSARAAVTSESGGEPHNPWQTLGHWRNV
jgi:acetyl-CoA/propionyl-CoA carboxylase biotin carboxyl carrier protein